jgi:hypothetical protein
MPYQKTTRSIKRQAMQAIHHPPSPRDKVTVSKEMQPEKAKMVKELIPFLMYLYKKHMDAKITEDMAVLQFEDINIPISVGDTILGGKFKNKRIVVKSIGKNEKGDITVNGRPLLKYRTIEEAVLADKIECDNCGWTWMKKDGGDDLYHCHKCGHDNEKYDAADKSYKRLNVGESTLNEFGGTLFHLVGFDSNNKPVQKIIKRASDSFMKDVAKYGSEKLFKSGKNVEYVKIYYDKTHLATVKDSGRTIVKEKGWGKLPINEAITAFDIASKIVPGQGDKFEDLVHQFITDNGLDYNKVYKYIEKGPHATHAGFMSRRRDLFNAIDAKPNNAFRKRLVARLKESTLNEIPMGDLQKIDQFADKKLNPVDVVLTDKHFFDRLNDPRNGKEISQAELIGFFKRLSKKKKEFVEFLNQYNSLVAVDDRTNINIPFMKQANKAIAKTVMRKKDFKTPDKKLDI